MCYKLQKMPECDCLSIQHHNVEPILRVPRYELLLQDALHLVSKAAKNSNEAMERNEKFQKLLNIYQRLSGVNMDFISPTRDFVKEGPITKISARSGEKQSRYLFLFSDLLLICTGTLVGTYKVRNELSVDGMKIKQGDNPNIPGSVVVHSKQKVIEILDENFALGDPGWYDALTHVIQEYRNRSFRNESEYHGSLPEREMLGKLAPRWIPDDASPCCMACQKTFTAIFRRHHCRSCGKLICKDCSRKAPLAYKYYKSARVCIHCRDVITSSCQDKTPLMDRKQWKDNLQGESYKSLTQKGQEVKHMQRTFSKLPEVPKPFLVKSSEASASSLCTPYTNDEPSPTDVTSGTTFARDQSCASSDCLRSDRCHICGISADEGNYVNVSFDNYADDAGAYENVSFDNSQECDDMNLSDASWSDTENEFSEHSDDLDDALAVMHIEPTGQITAPRDKLYMTAKELLDTERTYVQRLATLHQEFYLRLDRENRQRAFLPSDVLNQMFSSVPCIHRLHQDFLLPELELRMQNWDSLKKIGDLMKKNAPCLKMYTDYIKNYNNAMHLISLWLDKSPRFAAIIQEIQQMPECGNLTLQHLMLELKLRVSQYQHLLEDYLKYLPDDSPDRQDAQDALEIITQAVCHYNKAVKENEKFIKLLDIYQRLLGVGMDFISPTRDYVKEGPVTQISALGGEKQPRYLFLFNDLLLICVEPSAGVYEVVLSLNMEKMEVKEGDKANFPGTFVVQSGEKVIELLDDSTGDNPGWYEVLRNVMQEYEDSSQSLQNESQPQETNAGQELLYYKEASCCIPDSAVTSCRTCQQTFSPFRRRHHCPLCGMSVCKGCSKKAPLASMDHRMKRVCVPCHDDIVHARLCQN